MAFCRLVTTTMLTCLVLVIFLGPRSVISAKENYTPPSDEWKDFFPPKFKKDKPSLVVRESAGHTFNLSCSARGEPRPTIQWYKNGIDISPNNKNNTRRFQPFEVTKKGLLWIKNASPDDDGNYTCVVENPLGRIERQFDVKIVPRIVAHKPEVPAGQPGNHTVLEGSSLVLHCKPQIFEVSSPPTIKWMKHVEVNGSLEDEDGNFYVETLQFCELHGLCILLDSNYSYIVEDAKVLNLVNLSVDQSGWYSCEVENDMGRSQGSGFVNVMTELPVDPVVEEAERKTRGIIYAMVSLVPILIIALGGSIFCLIRWRREVKQKLYAASAFKNVYHWTKVVLIEKQHSMLAAASVANTTTTATTAEEQLLDPKVTIQKRRLLPSEGDECPESEYELLPDPAWEIDRSELCPYGTVGEGAFGKVVKASMQRSPRRLKELQKADASAAQGCTVAVKMLKEGHSEGDLVDLVKEMEIMKVIGSHPNIVNLLGVSTQPPGKPLLLIIEYAERGNLKDFLVSSRAATSRTSSVSSTASSIDYELPMMSSSSSSMTVTVVDLQLMLRIALDVAKGMEFLSMRKCVHRDLAARNVLVTHDLVFKIADFGMARDIKSCDYYRKVSGGRLPIKWMAPESVFEARSTTKSDVWSFGILLWEIVTLGESPHKGVPIDLFLDRLRKGQIMPQPTDCPDNVYSLMCQCWELRPDERPTWADLVNLMKMMYR